MKQFVLTLMAAAVMSVPAAAQSKVLNLSTSASVLPIEQLQDAVKPVQLSRYLFAGYNTICLPMDVDAEQMRQAAGEVRLERLAAVSQEGATVAMYFVDCTAEGIKAGQPYLIYSPKTQYMRVKSDGTNGLSTALTTVRMSDSQGNRVAFASSWESRQQDGLYGIPAQQPTTPLQSVLVRTTGDKTFLPTRCGFAWEQQSPTASNLVIKHISDLSELGDATAIKAVVGTGEPVDVFDLNGRVVKRQAQGADALKGLSSGVYVVGGEKVVVK